uniref:non-specific serine/threonine protein kinase n=1 Tax=Triticum urartu TaxID=4572 RepID=A0A8R7VJ11_TRIUA
MGIKHPNVVECVGCCAESSSHPMEQSSGSGKYILAETRKRLLCFEYVSNKSLDKHITDESSGLEWNTRYKIIKGICNGLHFLHEECHMVHLDLKPQNILLNSTMMPKIADFGLSRIFGELESRTVTKHNNLGTLGYMAPEYLHKGVVSYKADIFSLGVIVIEIITGGRDYPMDYPYFQ